MADLKELFFKNRDECRLCQVTASKPLFHAIEPFREPLSPEDEIRVFGELLDQLRTPGSPLIEGEEGIRKRINKAEEEYGKLPVSFHEQSDLESTVLDAFKKGIVPILTARNGSDEQAVDAAIKRSDMVRLKLETYIKQYKIRAKSKEMDTGLDNIILAYDASHIIATFPVGVTEELAKQIVETKASREKS